MIDRLMDTSAVEVWLGPGAKARIIADRSVPHGQLRTRHDGREWVIAESGMIARVDGGDPGDENDGDR